jgi:4-amino-4-deoxy-L-arabinose transferase-like glycosyltransferase
VSRQSRSRSSATDTGAPLSPLPSTGPVTTRPLHWLLAVFIAIYIVAAGIHASLVPVGQTGYQNAPDEAAHVNYVRILATGRLPTQRDAARDPQQRSYEWHQPPLYYALATTCLSVGPKGMRIVSILCGVAAICLIYLCAWRLFPAEPDIAVLAAGIAALTPGHIAVTSVVSNDALLEVCCTGAVFALVMALRNGFSLWRAGWLGLAVGAAMLTKVTGILLLPILALALPLLKLGGESNGALARGYAWCLAVVILTCGWWYVRNGLIFHELVPLKTFEASFRGTAQAADIAHRVGGWDEYWRISLMMTFMSFWAVYGTPLLARQGGIPGFLPDPIYELMALVCLCVFAGMVRLHLRRRELTATQQRAIWIMFALLALVGLSFISFLARYFQTQGRYLYPAMVSICIIMALGWRMLFPPRYRTAAAGLLLAVLATFTAIFLLAVLQTVVQ